MSRKGYIAIVTAAILLLSISAVFAIDPPHGSYDCSACHSLHGSTGAGLINQPDNATLCINCHNTGSLEAPDKPFASGMIAVPGTSGHSHNWEDTATLPAAPTDADSQYGLVAISELTIPGLQMSAQRYDDLGEGITCGVCHNQHAQTASSWDPIITDSGTTDTDGAADGSTVVDSGAGWGALAGFNVKITSGAFSGEVRVIQSNTATELTLTTPFSGQILSGVTYEIDDDDSWHFMRVDNDLNQLCEDCHQWRTTANETDTRTYTGNRKSHPIVSDISGDVTDSTQFVGVAPRENNGNAQTGAPRYSGNGTGDTIVTNNIVFDATGKIRCLSCHGIHYSDSDAATEEDWASVGAGDGNLLKRSVEDTCHGCHKTERNTPGADPDKILMHNSDNLTDAGWGTGWGTATGQYGEFGCTTCHTPHGTDNIYLIRETITTPDLSNWGDAGAQASPDVTVDFRDVSGTAGGTTGAYSFGDDTACVHTGAGYDNQTDCELNGGTWDASVPRCTFPAFTDSGACTGAGHIWNRRTTSTRMCEACHSKNTYHNYDSTDADQTGYGHNNGAACTGCHDHKGAFAGAGGPCNTCHAYDTTGGFWQIGDGYACQDDPICEGKGAHAKHIDHIKSVKGGLTLDPATDSFGAGNAGIVCGTCHTIDSGNHMTGGRVIEFGGVTTYQFGPGAPTYNGVSGTSSTVNLKSCSSVSCHFKETPGWHDPATPGP
jgi:predicted CXXCH cytochrome family protein